MLAFIKQFGGTIVLLILLALGLFFALRYAVRERRGGGCCGCSSSACPHSGKNTGHHASCDGHSDWKEKNS